jgi:hypothetical protein
MEKMKMTSNLGTSLMDDLFLLYLCSKGMENHTVGIEEDGFPILDEQVIAEASDYARSTFIAICNEFEAKEGQRWQIRVDDEDGE